MITRASFVNLSIEGASLLNSVNVVNNIIQDASFVMSETDALDIYASRGTPYQGCPSSKERLSQKRFASTTTH